MKNINNHNFIKESAIGYYSICSKCKVQKTNRSDNIYEFYYLNETDVFPTDNLENTSCEEIIIKKILE